MKRCIFGAVLLAVLPVLCLFGERAGSQGPDRVADLLIQAEQAPETKTAALAAEALAAWETTKPVQRGLRHREKLQRIDVLFQALQALEGEEPRRFRAVSRSIRVMLEDLQFPD